MDKLDKVLKDRFLSLIVILFFLSAQVAWAATATVDLSVVIESGVSTISVLPTVLNMGTLTRTASAFRFAAGPIAVSFSALQTADLLLYTDDASDRVGMIGTNGELMQLRAWTANFGVGTGGTPPDVQNDANWNDPVTAVWSPVKEVDATGKLTLLSGVATASGSADVFVGVDSLNVTTQQYQTQLVFEILNQ